MAPRLIADAKIVRSSFPPKKLRVFFKNTDEKVRICRLKRAEADVLGRFFVKSAEIATFAYFYIVRNKYL